MPVELGGPLLQIASDGESAVGLFRAIACVAAAIGTFLLALAAFGVDA